MCMCIELIHNETNYDVDGLIYDWCMICKDYINNSSQLPTLLNVDGSELFCF